jgi:hypothetical protein
MTTTATPSASLEIEFWFEFGSNYSYLSVMRIEEEAHRLSVRIAWKPFLLGPIFRALGMENSPFVLQKGERRLNAAGHGPYVLEVRLGALGQAQRISASVFSPCGSRGCAPSSRGSAPSPAK